MAQPEHALQISIVKWVRDCVAVDHEFHAFDRSKKQSEFQHVREKSRGIRRGCADTMIEVVNLPNVWVEIKWPPNKPTEAQLEFAAAVERVGRKWYWADSVDRFRECLVAAGVPLRPNAAIVAAHLDALLASAAIRKSGKAPKSYRRPATKGTRSQIAAANRGALFTGRGV
jgi:hypothetical protein